MHKLFLLYRIAFIVPLSRLTQFCPLPHQAFEKNIKGRAMIPEAWIQESEGFLLISLGLKSSYQRKKLS